MVGCLIKKWWNSSLEESGRRMEERREKRREKRYNIFISIPITITKKKYCMIVISMACVKHNQGEEKKERICALETGPVCSLKERTM